MSWCGLFCDDKINVTETGQGNELAWDVSLVYPIVHSKASTYADDSGTGVKGSSAIEIIPKLEEVSCLREINIYLLTFSDWNRTTRVPKSVPRG